MLVARLFCNAFGKDSQSLPGARRQIALNGSRGDVFGQGCTASEDRSASEEKTSTRAERRAGSSHCRGIEPLRVRTSEASGPAAAISRCHAIPRRTEAKRRRTERTRSYFTHGQNRARVWLRAFGTTHARQKDAPVPRKKRGRRPRLKFEPARRRAPAATRNSSSTKRYEA